MAKGKKTGGKDFKPGVVTNPKGAAAHNPVVKQLRTMTQEHLGDILVGILEGKDFELDPNATVLQKWVSAGVKKAMQRGDLGPFNSLMDRVVGKVKEVRENTGDMSIKVIVEDYLRKEDK